MSAHRCRALALLLLVLPVVAHAAAGGAAAVRRGMVRIPAGSYRPIYVAAGESYARVSAFALDRLPVTRGEYLAFVTRHAEWRRGAVRGVHADAAYLADWPSATSAGDATDLRRPVTNVSWFAARAYCAERGARLPTVDEWEYVAAASATRRDARGEPGERARRLALYARRAPGRPPVVSGAPNAYGVRALHGLVWEWTLDFNSVVVADDSRAAGGGQDARDHRLFCASAAIGAADPSDYPAFARAAVRAGLTARTTTSGVGFRCAATLPA